MKNQRSKGKFISEKKLPTGIIVQQVRTPGAIQIIVPGPEVIPFRFQPKPSKGNQERTRSNISYQIKNMALCESARISNHLTIRK